MLTGYDHCSIPQIEQYANQQEWVEGTLVEEFSEEELAERAIKNLEKVVDLESFGHVFFTAPRHLGESTSSTTISQQPAQASAQPVATDKGKEVQHSEEQFHNLEQQEAMADQPAATDQQAQGQDRPIKVKAVEIPILQLEFCQE